MRQFRSLRAAMLLAGWVALCGFKFERHHITDAPIVDTTAPFFGSGLVIGPQEHLPGVAKRVPVKLRMYKWLMRKGDTQYVPGVRREVDCSLTEIYVDLADLTAARTRPGFQARLRAAAGLAGTAGSYPDGCADPMLGLAGRNLAGGRLPSGQYYGAGPDFHEDTAIALYRSDGQSLLDTHDITLAPDGSNRYIGYLAVADFNDDGKPDYAIEVSAYGDDAVGRIAILLGDGIGGYATPGFLTVATAPADSGKSVTLMGFTVADFDGDDHLDIASTFDIGGNASGMVQFRGHGDGAFDAAVAVAADIGYGVLAADFNGDTRLDLATGDAHVLFGDGAGGFSLAPGQRYAQGDLAAADFDDDGNTDLAVYEPSGDGSPISIWLGDGSGQFSRIGPGYSTGYGSGSADLGVTDLDGDGHLDIVVGSAGGGLYGASINSQGQTQFLLGRGDGSFASPPFWSGAVAAIADFDRDGNPDLLRLDTTTSNHGVRPLLGDGAGGVTEGPLSTLGFSLFGGLLTSWSAADLDGDDNADLIATATTFDQPPQGRLHARLGNGDGTFDAGGQDIDLAFGAGAGGYNNGSLPVFADFTGDGALDIALTGYTASGSTLYLLAGTGDGSLQAPQAVDATLVGGGDPPDAVAAADFDADGKLDLAVIDAGKRYDDPPLAGSVRVYRNLGGGSFAAASILPGTQYPEALAAGDVDGNGTQDIVVAAPPAAYANDTLFVYLGNGNATFQPPRTQALSDIWFTSIALGDTDSDGKADLVVGNCCGLTFAWYARGDGTGTFATPAILPLAVSPQVVRLASLTGSGRLDLVVGGGYGATPNVRTYLNTWKDSIFRNGFEGG